MLRKRLHNAIKIKLSTSQIYITFLVLFLGSLNQMQSCFPFHTLQLCLVGRMEQGTDGKIVNPNGRFHNHFCILYLNHWINNFFNPYPFLPFLPSKAFKMIKWILHVASFHCKDTVAVIQSFKDIMTQGKDLSLESIYKLKSCLRKSNFCWQVREDN